MKDFKYKRTYIVLIVISILLFSLAFYLLTPLPMEDQFSTKYPLKFSISKLTTFEVQGHNQCSAFSTAFLLRTLGSKANGDEVYRMMSYKVPISGYVLPKGIVTQIKSFGWKPTINRGSLSNLKSRLALGKPVIVLIGKGFRWQHYMTLVGYDSNKKELYFFDSKKETDTNGSLAGNRTLSEQYFLSMWNNGLPIFNHIYIGVVGHSQA